MLRTREALEPMVEGLIGHLDGDVGLTPRLHQIVTLLVIQAHTLLRGRRRAHRIGDNATGRRVGRHLDRFEDRLGKGQDAIISAGPDRHLQGQDVVLQGALLPHHVLAVLVPVPDLLALVVDDPLGVALLAGDVLADGSLLRLLENLDPGGLAQLGGVGPRLELVIVKESGGGGVCAVGVGLHLADCDGDGGAGRLGHLVAAPLHAVGADVHGGGVVEDVAVPGDVDAVILVAGFALVMAAAAGEGGGEAAKSGQEEEEEGVSGCCHLCWEEVDRLMTKTWCDPAYIGGGPR